MGSVLRRQDRITEAIRRNTLSRRVPVAVVEALEGVDVEDG